MIHKRNEKQKKGKKGETLGRAEKTRQKDNVK